MSKGIPIKGSFYISTDFHQGKWTFTVHDHTTEKEVLICKQSSTVSEQVAAGKAFLALIEYFWMGPGRGRR